MQKTISPTSRQWRLYDFIKQNSLNNEWTTQDQIIASVYGYVENTSDKAHDKCVGIWQDIQALNDSVVIQKIILIKDNTYKLATESEANEFIEHKKRQALIRLQRVWNLTYKVNADGQGRLLTADNEVIDKNSMAREFIETFIKGE